MLLTIVRMEVLLMSVHLMEVIVDLASSQT